MRVRFGDCGLRTAFTWKSMKCVKNTYTTAINRAAKVEPFELMFRQGDIVEVDDENSQQFQSSGSVPKRMTTI